MNVATVETSFIPTTQRWSIPLLTVFVLWIAVLFDPHYWLADHGLTFLPQVPKFIYLGLALMIISQMQRAVWYPPLLLFMAAALMASAFAENVGVAQDRVVKILLLYYVLAIGSMTFIKSVGKTTLVLHLFLWQFLWWSLHAAFRGSVSWHPTLANEDGFGPMMVLGLGYCFYFGMAAKKRGLRLMAFLLAGLSLIGVVSSFARGAVLAAGFLALYMWYRSGLRGQTFAAAALGLGIVGLSADVLFPGGAFWKEMSTVSEGFGDATGLERWLLWRAAWQTFLSSPIFGVGAGNFGIFAGDQLWLTTELKDYYNQGHLWGKAVHSVYFQMLAEFGLAGTMAFVALLIDFWRRNAQLRSEPFVTAWWSATGQVFDLQMLSRALEAAMVGYLASGFFYDQLYEHWFYTIVAVNALLHWNAQRAVSLQYSDSHA